MTKNSICFAAFICLIASLSSGMPALAAADKTGNNAEVYLISVDPETISPGMRPRIQGFVHNTSSLKNGDDGWAVFDITAVVIAPGGSRKAIAWSNVKFSAGQKKFYSFDTFFDTARTGTYKIIYSVHNTRRTFTYASASKSFTVAQAPAADPKKTPAPGARMPKTMPQQAPGPRFNPPKSEKTERVYVGVGGFIDSVNTSGGGTLILWPFENLALQGTYGKGTFTSYQARTFYRFPLSEYFNPYLGAGFLHAERDLTVIDTEATIKKSSFTVFGGLEIQLYKNLYGYLDVSATPITELKQDVINGSRQATVTVEYSPVTINAAIVLYLF